MGHLEVSRTEFKSFFDEMFPEGLKTIKSILDVGCSDVSNAEFFSKLNLRWNGIDINPAEFITTGDMNNIPFSNSRFNFLFCSHAFEHTTNPIQTLKEFHRVCGAGGVVFLNTPYPTPNQHFAMDKEHLFCLSQHHLERLFFHCNIFPIKTYIFKEDEKNEDRWHIITIGRVI